MGKKIKKTNKKTKNVEQLKNKKYIVKKTKKNKSLEKTKKKL